MDLYTKILPKRQKALINKLATDEWIAEFYLAGGTALALQIGHRLSIDFDFFCKTDFDKRKVLLELLQYGRVIRLSEAKGTLHCSVAGVKLSFFHYPYRTQPFLRHGFLNIASLLDIALMKLEAIAGRGDKKDFIDLSYILTRFSLTELLSTHVEKYGVDWSNRYHLLKSLIYFADADEQPMPKMLVETSWPHVKQVITKAVLQIDPLH